VSLTVDRGEGALAVTSWPLPASFGNAGWKIGRGGVRGKLRE
jgi:hypothetical protein